ncbi:MAG: hypothetical protein QM786_19380 [Breznakibacter sp.]
MMDFISIPAVVGIITLGIYKLFELFVRRRERLNIIEKVGEKIDPSFLGEAHPIPVKISGRFSFGSLKAACLLIGIGLGLLIGYTISLNSLPYGGIYSDNYQQNQLMGVIFGASVLVFSGLGLLTAFVIEMKIEKKNKNQ